MSSITHVITWITEVKTIKRQTGWLVICQPVGAGLAYGLYASVLCDNEQRLCSCGMRLDAGVICLCVRIAVFNSFSL